MELAVVGSTKTLSVSDAVFGREFSEDLVHQVVVAYRNAGRAGTKAQLTRSEVRGTTKKFKKQKGGGARHGDYRAPIFIGGGVTFAAKPRSFEQKVNRKMYRAAMCAILSELNRQDRLKVVFQEITESLPGTLQKPGVRLKSITQPFVGKPVKLVIRCKHPEKISKDLEKYLLNRLYEHMGLDGIPLILEFRE